MFFFVDFPFFVTPHVFCRFGDNFSFYALQIYNFPALIFLHLWNIIFFCSKSKFKSNGNYLMSFYYFFSAYDVSNVCPVLYTNVRCPFHTPGTNRFAHFYCTSEFFSCHWNFLWASRNTGFFHETHVTHSFLPNLELFCVSQHYVHNTIEFFPSMCPFHP